MEVNDVVNVAKQHIASLFRDEGVRNVGLEEVEFEEKQGMWLVSIGFSRPWDEPKHSYALVVNNAETKRSYKIVRVRDSDGEIVSVKSLKGTT